MLRKTLLYLSNQQRVFSFVRRNRLAKRMASRFVAGETAEEAMAAVRTLNARGITAPRGGKWHAAQVKAVLER